MEDLAEFRQLKEELAQIDLFIKWFGTATLKELQLATLPNQIELPMTKSADLSTGTESNLEFQLQ